MAEEVKESHAHDQLSETKTKANKIVTRQGSENKGQPHGSSGKRNKKRLSKRIEFKDYDQE